MASGWNLCVWLPCIGVVSGCCCKEVYNYIDILTIVINFPYSTCISSFFCSSIPSLLLCSLKKKKFGLSETEMAIFNLARRAHNCAMLYTHSIGNQPLNTIVVFRIRDSLPSTRYSPVCNVLRQWKTSLIPTCRVYRHNI